MEQNEQPRSAIAGSSQTALRLPRGFHIHRADQGFDTLGVALGTIFLVFVMLADGLKHVEFMTAFTTFKFIGRHVTVPLGIFGASTQV